MNRMKAAKGAKVVKCPGDEDDLSITQGASGSTRLNTKANDKEHKYDEYKYDRDLSRLNTKANDTSTNGASGILFSVFLLPLLLVVVQHRVC